MSKRKETVVAKVNAEELYETQLEIAVKNYNHFLKEQGIELLCLVDKTKVQPAVGKYCLYITGCILKLIITIKLFKYCLLHAGELTTRYLDNFMP